MKPWKAIANTFRIPANTLNCAHRGVLADINSAVSFVILVRVHPFFDRNDHTCEPCRSITTFVGSLPCITPGTCGRGRFKLAPSWHLQHMLLFRGHARRGRSLSLLSLFHCPNGDPACCGYGMSSFWAAPWTSPFGLNNMQVAWMVRRAQLFHWHPPVEAPPASQKSAIL